MKKLNIYLVPALLLSVVLYVAGCYSSVLVDIWHDTSFRESPLKKIFVIAVRKDYAQRRLWEDAFVIELGKEGVSATASYRLFPESLPDTGQIIKVIQDKGYDGILVTHLLETETTNQYVNGYDTQEQIFRYNRFRKRYDSYFRTVQHPGYVETLNIYRKSIDVWVILDEEKLIWSATSNTPERTTIEAVQDDVANLVIPELSKNSIIKQRK